MNNTSPDILEQISRGDVFIFRRGLQALGCFQELLESIYQEFDEIDLERGTRLRKEGVQTLHLHFSGQEIFDANCKNSERLAKKSIDLTSLMVCELLGQDKQGFHVDKNLISRFFV